MAGTLVISTLSDGTNSTSTTNCISGSAKAWVNFNGVSGASIRASYNVSSITYVASGKYTINFTNAMSDANYAVTTAVDVRNVNTNSTVDTAYNSGGRVYNAILSVSTQTPQTTGALTLATVGGYNYPLYEQSICNVAIFR